jgi:hypothetical protein
MSSVLDAKRSDVGWSDLRLVRVCTGGCLGSLGGIQFLSAPCIFSFSLPLYFRPFPTLVFSLKGLIVEKPPCLAGIRTVNMFTIGADDPDLGVSD